MLGLGSTANMIGCFIVCYIHRYLVRIIQKHNSINCFILYKQTGLKCENCQKTSDMWTHAKAFLRTERVSLHLQPPCRSVTYAKLSHTLTLTLTPVTQHFAYAAEQQPVCLSLQTRLLQHAEPQSAATLEISIPALAAVGLRRLVMHSVIHRYGDLTSVALSTNRWSVPALCVCVCEHRSEIIKCEKVWIQ